MAVDANTITKNDLVAQSIDFTEQFNDGLQTLLRVLGVTRMTPMTQGSQIKIYKSEVTKANGNVGEGETIPLSKVTRRLDHALTLEFNKYRKVTTAEAIQSSGFQAAVTDTDSKLLKEIHGDVKKEIFDFVGTGNTKANGADFQKALGAGLGQLAVKWEDNDVQSVAFVNPIDFYNYVGAADITMQTAFGLQYIQNFMGVNTVILSGNVKQGTIDLTASQNINYAYAAINGALSSAFDLTTDETGLIGVAHNPVNESLSYQTVIFRAGQLFAERLDGVVVSSIQPGSATSAH
jgi:hypothetical protein